MLRAGAEGSWRLQEVGAEGLAMPLGHFFNKQLRLSETLSFIELYDKRDMRVDTAKPESLACVGKYMAHSIDGKTMRIKVYIAPWTNPGVWYELRRFFFRFATSPDAMSRAITSNWHHWVKWVEPYTEYFYALRQAFDVRGTVEQHYLRCTDVASVSTADVLLK